MSAHRKDQHITQREPTAREQEALAWLCRRDRGLTREQQVEFENWLAADPRHAELLGQFDDTWALLEEAAGPPVTGAGRPADDSGRSLPVGETGKKRGWVGRRATWLPLGIAAALAVGYVNWWRPAHYSTAAGTEVGALRTMKLPDGSVVMLNTDSAVSVAFTPDERRVRLARGEAHFDVAKNPTRPFVVEANGVAVQAIGTAFKIRLHAAAVEVLVTAGKVRVDDAIKGGSLLPAADRSERAPNLSAEPRPVAESLTAATAGQRVLSAGERAVVPVPSATNVPAVVTGGSRVMPVALDEMQRELAWQDRRLEFVSASLAEVVTEFNRYHRHQLVIADPRLAERRFGGSFKPHDRAGFVRMLQENFGVVPETGANRTTLRLAD